MEDSNHGLIRAIGMGDHLAFECLVRRYQSLVLNFIYRCMEDRRTAEDLTQEVFLRVFRASSEFEPRGKDMHCKESRERISAYVDNELDAAASRSVASHIEQCGSCREYLHDIRNVDVLVQGLRTLEPPPDFTRQVIAGAREWDTCTSGKYPDRTIHSALIQLFESLLEALQKRKTANTHTLDEFNDFPPLSMSSAYFRILGQAGRG